MSKPIKQVKTTVQSRLVGSPRIGVRTYTWDSYEPDDIAKTVNELVKAVNKLTKQVESNSTKPKKGKSDE